MPKKAAPYTENEKRLIFEAAVEGLGIGDTQALLKRHGHRRTWSAVKGHDERARGMRVRARQLEQEAREAARQAAQARLEGQAGIIRFKGYNNGGQPFYVSLPAVSIQAGWNARQEDITW